MALAKQLITERKPPDLISCVLLSKDRPREVDVSVDYSCFDIPNEFVVGYGLDFNGYYRNLPEIVTLKPHVIEAAGVFASGGASAAGAASDATGAISSKGDA
jgi:hypothetical protein